MTDAPPFSERERTRGRRMRDVLAAEMFSISISIRLCTAFSALGMWELVGIRVVEALVLVMAGIGRGCFSVAAEAREWLGVIGGDCEGASGD